MNPPPRQTTTRRHQRIGLVWLLSALLTLVGVYSGYRLYLAHKVKVKIGQIRQAGLPVTTAELNKWYAAVPPDENAALILTNAFAHLVKVNTNTPNLPIIGRGKLPPRNEPLSPEMSQAIADYVATNQMALELLEKGLALKSCRYPVDLTPGVDALLPHLSKLKASAQLLELDALINAEAGDFPGATRRIEAMWALSESLAQEPIIISQLLRIACREMALSTLERILTRHSLGTDELVDLSRMLNADRDDAALRRGWIGERCFGLDIFHMPSAKLKAFLNNPTGSGETEREWSVSLGDLFIRLSGHMDRDELFFLECRDSYIRAIDVPCPARLQLSDAVSRKIARARDYRKGEPWPFTMSGLLLTSLGKVFEKVAVHSAHCKAATVSVALEEYRRRQNGHLPESLQLLAPTWIGQIPAVATATFVGEYMQGYLINPVPSGLSIRASKSPASGPVALGLVAPVLDGDVVTKMINGVYHNYAYRNGLWIDDNGAQVGEPVIGVGESFWIFKPTDWEQISSVWP